jgi:PKD repeat protein
VHTLHRTAKAILLLGVAGLLAFAGCTDQNPAAPEAAGGPRTTLASSGAVLRAFGTPSAIDGVLDSGWDGAAQASFTAYRAGQGGARTTEARLHLQNDGSNLYFAVTFAEPLPDPGNAVKLVLRKGGAEYELGVSGGSAYGADGAYTETLTSPKLVYEFAKPLTELGAAAGTEIEFRLEVTPGGNAQNAYFPGQNSFSTLRILGSVAGNQPPVAVASAEPGIGYARITEINFSSAGSRDNLPEGASLSYSWEFGDGTTSTDANPSRTFTSPGVYHVVLTVTDALGAATPTTVQVTIHPSVEVTVGAGLTGGRCDVTVTARNKVLASDDFHVQRADALCKARFGVAPDPDPIADPGVLKQGQSYVFAIRNTLIGQSSRFRLWPNQVLDFDTDPDLPDRLSAVCVENGGMCDSRVLIPTTYEDARNAATPLPAANRDLSIDFQPLARTIPCQLEGTKPALAYLTLLLPDTTYQIPALSGYRKGLGLYIAPVTPAGECQLNHVPEGQEALVEVQDEDGNVYRGLIPSTGNTPLPLGADPRFYHKTIEVDGYGDNPLGKSDFGLVRFGLLNAGTLENPVPGTTFVIKMSTRAVQVSGLTQFLFDFSEVRDVNGQSLNPSAYSLRVQCPTQRGACQISQVSPSSASTKILGAWGVSNPAGFGYVELHVNFTGVHRADLHARAGTADGFDHWPKSGSHRWLRSSVPGGTIDVSF